MVPQWFALGSAVHGGCTVILKKSFSASKFWPDVVKYKVTVGQYIGEIARFLLGKLKPSYLRKYFIQLCTVNNGW